MYQDKEDGIQYLIGADFAYVRSDHAVTDMLCEMNSIVHAKRVRALDGIWYKVSMDDLNLANVMLRVARA